MSASGLRGRSFGASRSMVCIPAHLLAQARKTGGYLKPLRFIAATPVASSCTAARRVCVSFRLLMGWQFEVRAGLGSGGVGGVSAWGSIGVPHRGRPKPAEPDFSVTSMPDPAPQPSGGSVAALFPVGTVAPAAANTAPAAGEAALPAAKPARHRGRPPGASRHALLAVCTVHMRDSHCFALNAQDGWSQCCIRSVMVMLQC